MGFRRIFITVGTTYFTDLITVVKSPEMAEVLRDLDCEEMTVQSGKESLKFGEEFDGIATNVYSVALSIEEDIKEADLVISHAGAGTCIEVLKHKKPLIVVINDSLMGNHQVELAHQLASEGVLIYCSPGKLLDTLRQFDPADLETYQEGSPENFIRELDKLMGFC
ncbi:UDP-N-acetylglucosamine transferase subunit ALG13 homolog [Sergentomyia squamirostris]